MARVAGRAGGADAEALGGAVHPLEDQVQPAGALAGLLQRGADGAGQAGDHGGEGLGGEQRFDEAQPVLRQAGGEDGVDRLEHRALELVQAQRDQRAEAAGQRGARQGLELADPLQAEQVEGVEGVGGQAEGGDGEVCCAGCGGFCSTPGVGAAFCVCLGVGAVFCPPLV